MNLFALLPLLVLTLLQGTLATHLETCQCDQVKQLVNSTVQEAVTGLEDRLSLLIRNNMNTTDNSALENLENRYHGATPYTHTDYHLPIEPNSQDHPATSCQDAFEKYRNAQSGYYLISRSGSASLNCQSVLFHESHLWQSDREGSQYRHEEQQPHLSQWIEPHLIS